MNHGDTETRRQEGEEQCRRRWPSARHFLLCLLCVSVSPWFISSSSAADLAVLRDAPPFALKDQDDKPLRLGDLRGKVVLVSFIFTTCSGSCPATTSRMNTVARE